ncbi:ArsR family transcriptional regulator [Pseudonocardia sulfidoxydans NBRC 16205]|uniref:ArsR family transcriptional regulator n=1 Tax=Pseudonocardia sulfidoxydans NBRC 16205 TaxID=1223511 RepID=A0A511D9F6_9PSEU|nr:winged helix-turn-helix domain-containing protein [Pseudonocardia sulfidoxydans]GEL21421.1 ArsR family transcriptional regulator [Pseudonocardia sulfidoxydans NBRC 16205]
MVAPAPPLLPVFRSRLQGDLLAVLLVVPGTELTLTALAGRTGGSLAAVQRETSRLEEAGILRSRRIGNARLVSADPASPAIAPLTELVTLSFGPVQVLAEEFDGIADVDALEVFGSWAARHHGEHGAPPADVDVLVVGSPDRDTVHDAATRAEERIGLPVNATVVAPQRWESGTDGFVTRVRESSRVPVPRR